MKLISNGVTVEVSNSELEEMHANGMSWARYEMLRATMTHEEAIHTEASKWRAYETNVFVRDTGYMAYGNGSRLDDNPYDADGDFEKFQSWREGWFCADSLFGGR